MCRLSNVEPENSALRQDAKSVSEGLASVATPELEISRSFMK
jgi:hypothetical protein